MTPSLSPTSPTPSSAPTPRPAAPSARALQLGYVGLAPFVAGAVLAWLVRPDAHPYVVSALSAYAAVIVSLLGGIHWGLGFMRNDAQRCAWGVLPPLAAWVAVVMPPYAGLVIHGLMLLACYAVDRRVYPAYGLQAWLVLRFRLSSVAALSCFIGAAGS